MNSAEIQARARELREHPEWLEVMLEIWAAHDAGTPLLLLDRGRATRDCYRVLWWRELVIWERGAAVPTSFGFWVLAEALGCVDE